MSTVLLRQPGNAKLTETLYKHDTNLLPSLSLCRTVWLYQAGASLTYRSIDECCYKPFPADAFALKLSLIARRPIIIIIIIIIIIKRQFIRSSNMASHYKGAVQCSLLVLWKQLVSEIGTRVEMLSWARFWTLIMSMPNDCPVKDCSRRPDQPQKMPSCWVVALFWVDQITTSSGTESINSINNNRVKTLQLAEWRKLRGKCSY